MITFTQKILSLKNDEINVCWIVENNSKNIINDAVAYSRLFCHNFGTLGLGSIKSISFTVPISKFSLLESAFMNYSQDNEAKMIQSK